MHADVQNALTRLMPEWLVRDVAVVAFLNGGYSNDNYHIRHRNEDYVLRIPTRPRLFVDRAHERLFYQQAAAGALQPLLPRAIAFDEPLGLLLTRYEPGELLALSSAAAVGGHPPRRWLRDLLTYLRTLHAHLPASGRRYDPVALSRAYLARGAPDPAVLRLAGRLRWGPDRVAPCHNDLNPWNVIIPAAGDPWITLDWEWFGDNDPVFDLVSLHQGLGWPDEGLLEMFTLWLHGEPDSLRLERNLIAFWLREYAWACAELAAGSKRVEVEQQLETSRRRLNELC